MTANRNTFPRVGTGAEALLEEMKEQKSHDAVWKSGRVYGYVYHPGDEVAGVVEEAYRTFFNENALNPSLFNSLKKFENETVSMAADLLNGGPDACGNLTSGGTESILMAVKTARDLARGNHPPIVQPEIIVPVTIHPAFEKAAHFLDVKVVHIPVGEDRRADVIAMEKAITAQTIMLAGSAPCFPYGVIDPVAEIGRLGMSYGIPVHVDACLGGFMLPFLEKLGHPVPLFDFRASGVTSMSADLHKYGYSAKGASVILYNSRHMRKHQYFAYANWPGGLYGSPTLLGTRCGGPIAAAWAVIRHLGCNGYLLRAEAVMETVRKIREGIDSIPGMRVIANPDMSVFAFTSDNCDIFAVGDELSADGWHLDRLQFPNCLHMTISYDNAGTEADFLHALKAAVKKVSAKKFRSFSSRTTVSLVKGLSRSLPESWFRRLSSLAAGFPDKKDRSNTGNSAAMYGITAAIENRENVQELILRVLDKMYRTG